MFRIIRCTFITLGIYAIPFAMFAMYYVLYDQGILACPTGGLVGASFVATMATISTLPLIIAIAVMVWISCD